MTMINRTHFFQIWHIEHYGIQATNCLNVRNTDYHAWYYTVVNVYLFIRRIYVLNSIEINKRSNIVYCIFFRLWHFQTSLNSHICINSPYVQTTKGKKSPPQKVQTSAVLPAMLVQKLRRGNTSPRKMFPLNIFMKQSLNVFPHVFIG